MGGRVTRELEQAADARATPVEVRAVEAVTAVVPIASARCLTSYAPSAGRLPKYPFSPVAIGRSIARIASEAIRRPADPANH